MSFVAGAGSAIGAFVGKECMTIVKKEYERNGFKKKSKTSKDKTLKKEEELD
jgi:hypothetical protein